MFKDHSQVKQAVEIGFGDLRALVIGDLMLDRYLRGEVHRISPEGPVPVVHLGSETYTGGGAANVALNLAGLGLSVSIAGFVGIDREGEQLLEVLQKAGISTHPIHALKTHPTVTKTRIIGGHQQMLRVDQEILTPVDEQSSEKLLTLVLQEIEKKPAVVVLSDYAKGTLPDTVCIQVIGAARKLGIPVLVDPKGKNYRKYRFATAISPNRQELSDACGEAAENLPALLEAGNALRKELDLDFMVVTLGPEGIALMDHHYTQRIPVVAREVYDVSGAGDTVIAVLAAGTAAELSRLDAVHLANLAAGVVVGRVGTVPVTKQQLLSVLSEEVSHQPSSKVCSLQELLIRVEQWRSRSETVVFTNGCFDLIHAGHVIFLETARRLGHHLVVGLNTDRSVRILKGAPRPIIGEEDRARVLAALTAIDAVVFFDEETPIELIKAIRPDVLAKGTDYTEDQVIGAREVKSWGGRLILIPLISGRSTTQIINSIGISHGA
jgi:D-beta-D-heptose 7-phosphate kinase/D-beta-D-heptose 1-phosphate adenosyltransferase